MDIVEQLRKSANIMYAQDGYTFRLGLQNEAADEIERLREALQKISAIEDEHINPPTTPSEANLWGIIEGCVRVAEKALGGE